METEIKTTMEEKIETLEKGSRLLHSLKTFEKNINHLEKAKKWSSLYTPSLHLAHFNNTSEDINIWLDRDFIDIVLTHYISEKENILSQINETILIDDEKATTVNVTINNTSSDETAEIFSKIISNGLKKLGKSDLR